MKYLPLVSAVILASCTQANTDIYNVTPTATASIEERQLSYEEQRQQIGEHEGDDWNRFVDDSGLSHRSNLIGETVIEGSVTSAASVATYKDLVLHVTFKAQTGTVLGEQDAVIYEYLKPGGSISLKRKFATPAYTTTVSYYISGTDHVIH